ncbi:MAG: type II secretion system protein [Candidatus Kerfeldbacteria bacterium]|nr:type II secretion system protein [Candidatus Kerfeldbacteria bacterium]
MSTHGTRFRAGFTIIELLIVIAIIGLLSSLVIFQFAGSNNPNILRSAQSILIEDIRTTMSWAQSGKRESTTGTVPHGYGLVLYPGTDTYTIYADLNADNQYTKEPDDAVVKTVSFEEDELLSNMVIESCTPEINQEGNPPLCDLFITRSNGIIFVNAAQNNDLDIVIKHLKSQHIETITLHRTTGQLTE